VPTITFRVFIVLLPSPAGATPPSEVQSQRPFFTGHFLVGTFARGWQAVGQAQADEDNTRVSDPWAPFVSLA